VRLVKPIFKEGPEGVEYIDATLLDVAKTKEVCVYVCVCA